MATSTHIDTTETFVRLYVFLSQYLDRCRDEAARRSFPEAELQAHLSATKAKMLDIMAVNRVVKEKVSQECARILALGETCLKQGGATASVVEEVKRERAILQNKTIALSDLLAVFRAAGN
ncbi:MAG: hypothetical protein EPO61_14410 [Nitrospirae bacterium]|nr:MAG: hypothetical protein EPO61_14410 [Nitrospirota bacterium]